MPSYKILDGATGTTLTEMGHESIDHDDLWSAKILATEPNVLKELHENFIKAGSTEIMSATYQMPSFILEAGNVSQMENPAPSAAASTTNLPLEISENAKSLARKIQNDENSVNFYAELGPFGASLHDGSEYTGSYLDLNVDADAQKTKIFNHHKQRMDLLLKNDSPFKLAAFSTFPALEEVKIICNMMNSCFPEIAYYVSVQASATSAEPNDQDLHTSNPLPKIKMAHGEPIEDFINFMLTQPKNCFGFGLNCVNKKLPIKFLKAVLKITSNSSKINKSLVFYPNIGKTWNGISHTWEEEDDKVNNQSTLQSSQQSEHYWVKEIHDHCRDLDINFLIGGCCGTLPKKIEELVTFMKSEGMEIH